MMSLLQKALYWVLKAFPNIEVVQECNDGFEGLKGYSTVSIQLIFSGYTDA